MIFSYKYNLMYKDLCHTYIHNNEIRYSWESEHNAIFFFDNILRKFIFIENNDFYYSSGMESYISDFYLFNMQGSKVKVIAVK